MILAFPPCTYLTVTGNRWFNVERYGDKARQRMANREDAAKFFMEFVNADCPRIAIENPVGHMSTAYRKPDQIIHPFMFGDSVRKGTCLWLKGLPRLTPTNMVDEGEMFVWTDSKGKVKRQPMWYFKAFKEARTQEERALLRSKTFPGIAKAMAEQWTKGE